MAAIKESGEMYLESILSLKKEKSNIRAIDLASHTGYSKPSISRALGLLKEDGFITINGAGYIELTEKGEAVAAKIYERHSLLTELFVKLGVEREVAVQDACKIEHVISEQTFARIKEHFGKGSEL